MDQPIFLQEQSNVKYAGFWQRFGALLVDGLVVGPVTMGLTYLNIISWKNPLVLVVITLLSVAYKPFMEFKYGATLGKMALNLKVTNLKFGKADLKEIVLRNIFHIVPSLVGMFFNVAIYNSPAFESISGFPEYLGLSGQSALLHYNNLFFGLITIVDTIVLLSDKQYRSWHDRVGGTFVIETR